MNDDFTALADRQLSRVRGLCAQVGFKYVDVAPNVFGGGIAVGFGPNDYTALSVMAGAENLLMLTSGVLKDLQQDRDAALEIVNRCNQSNTVFTVYLHDADVGWSLLAQRTTPVEAFFKTHSSSRLWLGDYRHTRSRYEQRLPKKRPWAVSLGNGQVTNSTSL